MQLDRQVDIDDDRRSADNFDPDHSGIDDGGGTDDGRTVGRVTDDGGDRHYRGRDHDIGPAAD